ncbi:hypothetical protein [Clostridium taeniosporum]|uniref:Uncharacterized protein n=1 Tax=Clostridium taeniosporum TaxID=394958 RepID=A0A2I6SDI0_9CLOT|nr:hypothetical protein [Clostridium taeniosporum]AUO15628.1 hypothetical protein BGI42_15975 [Clostridium taeniosporum]
MSFNIENLTFNELFKGEFIISNIDTDNRGNLIFSSNELNLFNIYTLKLGEKPKLSLKLFSQNLNFLVRK